MAGAQNKRNSSGAFRSCLIPYKALIFAWWFEDRKSAREIQTLLVEQFGLEVHWSTITRFIKVRSRKADPHEKPTHLLQKEQPRSAAYFAVPSEDDQAASEEQILPNQPEKGNIIQMLRNTSAQELGRMADEAQEQKQRK